MSRAVESMFWLGRHLERADGTASILDAHLHVLDDPWADENLTCHSALGIAGADVAGSSELDRHDLLRLLAVERSEPRSIASSFGAAREHALRARDFVSAELWEHLATTRSRTPRNVATERVGAFTSWVRERSALAVGMVETSARRDAAWRMFTIGRSIERAELTARTLALVSTGTGRWETILRSCGVYESYLRTSSHAPGAAEVTRLLVDDRHCPRSIRFCIERMETALGELDTVGPLEPSQRVTDAAASVRL